MPYSELNADHVIAAIDTLGWRIKERFPQAGLGGVCDELEQVARQCAVEADRISRPQIWIRALVASVWIAGALAALFVMKSLHFEQLDSEALTEAMTFVQFLDPAMNIAVLVGIGVVTLGQFEDRWKRARALDYLHKLRSIAHIVDMHQLTKDPYRINDGLPPTAHSPKHVLSAALMERYLDYCTEMLSLTGKLAAVLAEKSGDPEVNQSAHELEMLATGLARKIWQKIMVMERDATSAVEELALARKTLSALGPSRPNQHSEEIDQQRQENQ
ncbi:MAG: hypothetical protein AAF668_13430 [Pseudomonadota bacterium]